MQPIPPPHVLDPDRILANDRGDFTEDHKARAALLDDALHETCAYAKQLWDTLDAARAYLMESLPPDPHDAGPHDRLGARPAGPDDEEGWQNWMSAFAGVTSVLAGPQGDSGFGLQTAQHAAQVRRDAPSVHVTAKLHTLHEEAERTAAQRTAAEPRRRSTTGAAAGGSPAIARMAGGALVGILALRGLRPRRRAPRG